METFGIQILQFFRKMIRHSHLIWQKDKTKIDYALSNNFEILVIWEKDYRNNKENIIN